MSECEIELKFMCKNLIIYFYLPFSLTLDSVSLLKIQDAVLSYERVIEFKKSHCRLLIGKIRYMENKVSRLQKQLSEITEEKTQLKRQTVEREQECCSLRYDIVLLRKY